MRSRKTMIIASLTRFFFMLQGLAQFFFLIIGAGFGKESIASVRSTRFLIFFFFFTFFLSFPVHTYINIRVYAYFYEAFRIDTNTS